MSPVARQHVEVLLNQETIARRIGELGQQLTRDYEGKQLLVVGVLKGCMVFVADLVRAIQLPVEIEFIWASSYRKGTAAEEEILLGGGDWAIAVEGRHLLLVEGVIESGRTVNIISQKLRGMNPASLSIITLIDKPQRRRGPVEITYKGFTVGNEFIIGYGLDNTQQHRNLPFIGRLTEGHDHNRRSF